MVFVRAAQSNLAPLSMSVVSHPCGSPGAPAIHGALHLVLAGKSLCSGPKLDAAKRLCCIQSGFSPLRIDRIYNQAESHASMSQVCQVFNLTN